jgi:hypothetical protein
MGHPPEFLLIAFQMTDCMKRLLACQVQVFKKAFNLRYYARM